MGKFFAKLLLAALLLCGAWLAWALLGKVDPHGPKFVLLRPGSSARHIAAELQSAGVIHSSYAFLLAQLIGGGSLKAGEYEFAAPATVFAVRSRLVHGDVYFHSVVIPEGYTLYDIAAAIGESGLASRQEFVVAAYSDLSLIRDIAPEAPSLEGYLFPDTYRFTRTQNVHDLLAVMVRRFRKAATDAGLESNCSQATAATAALSRAHSPGVSASSPVPCTLHRVVTLASVIEKETAVAEERPIVASVYYNRLRAGMPLQADPSVIYAALVNGQYQGAIHRSDLQSDSPYNTYRHPGLPPGPIASPGSASLVAALHPATTDFLYFVSDSQGSHRFARTLEEHEQNVSAYRRALARAR